MVEFVDKQQIFIINNNDINTQSLANYLPDGDYFRAKNIEESNFRKLLHALAKEFGRTESKIKHLADDHYIAETVNLLSAWETMLGIPDECFKISNKTQEFRRKQCIAKYALMNLTTTLDFIALADFFGVRVEILNGIELADFFPLTFPTIFFNSKKDAKFTMVVYFPDIYPPSNLFPLTFPVTFGEDISKFILCLFNKLKPAPIKIIARYKGQITDGTYLFEDGTQFDFEDGTQFDFNL